jgi:hypothetical protein
MRGVTNSAPKSLSALTAIAVLGAIALGWVSLRDRDEPAVVTPSAPSAAPSAPLTVATADARPEPPAIVKLRELRAMSETYRNTTFVIAIRDAGFVCHELLEVHGGIEPSMAWTAACSDMLAYTVRVADTGSLAVEPLARYIDGLTPQIERRTEPSPTPLPRLPPEPLR